LYKNLTYNVQKMKIEFHKHFCINDKLKNVNDANIRKNLQNSQKNNKHIVHKNR